MNWSDCALFHHIFSNCPRKSMMQSDSPRSGLQNAISRWLANFSCDIYGRDTLAAPTLGQLHFRFTWHANRCWGSAIYMQSSILVNAYIEFAANKKEENYHIKCMRAWWRWRWYFRSEDYKQCPLIVEFICLSDRRFFRYNRSSLNQNASGTSRLWWWRTNETTDLFRPCQNGFYYGFYRGYGHGHCFRWLHCAPVGYSLTIKLISQLLFTSCLDKACVDASCFQLSANPLCQQVEPLERSWPLAVRFDAEKTTRRVYWFWRSATSIFCVVLTFVENNKGCPWISPFSYLPHTPLSRASIVSTSCFFRPA